MKKAFQLGVPEEIQNARNAEKLKNHPTQNAHGAGNASLNMRECDMKIKQEPKGDLRNEMELIQIVDAESQRKISKNGYVENAQLFTNERTEEKNIPILFIEKLRKIKQMSFLTKIMRLELRKIAELQLTGPYKWGC